jgi:hypothetical protein
MGSWMWHEGSIVAQVRRLAAERRRLFACPAAEWQTRKRPYPRGTIA